MGGLDHQSIWFDFIYDLNEKNVEFINRVTDAMGAMSAAISDAAERIPDFGDDVGPDYDGPMQVASDEDLLKEVTNNPPLW